MAANKFVKVAAAAVGVVMIGLLFSPTAGESRNLHDSILDI
jgi:hypothetical protein